MAKRNVFERALRSTRDLLTDYIKPGAQTAEDKIDDLLKALGDARRELARQRKRFGLKGGKSRRKSAKKTRRTVRKKAARRKKRV